MDRGSSIAATNWFKKAAKLRMFIYAHVKAEKVRRQDQAYRGPEHPWYAVWLAVLAGLCSDTKTLCLLSQTRVSHMLFGGDEEEKERSRVPDLGLARVVDHDWILQDNTYVESGLHQKCVLLEENKSLPSNTLDRTSKLAAVLEGRKDLLEQTRILFAGDPADASEKAIIGVSSAGDYWCWEILKATDFADDPLSENEDATYRPEQRSNAIESRIPEYFRMFTDRSDKAMREMLQEIRNLPSAKYFGERL